MGLLKKKIIKSVRFSNKKCTIESEMYRNCTNNTIYVIHCITDEKTHNTMQYEYGFTDFDNANSYFNSVLKGFIY